MCKSTNDRPRSRRGFGRIEKVASGRYRAGYTGPDGRLYRAPVTFDAKDDATAWLSSRRAEIEMQVWAPEIAARGNFGRTAPTLRAYGEHWVENRKIRGRPLRPTTHEHYQKLLEVYIYPAFGDKRIDWISVEDVNDWYDALAPGRETIRAQAYSLLRTILTTAATTRPHPLISYNPAYVRGAGNTTRVHKVQPASLDELSTIVEELPPRYKLMALLAAWCAMRFGELAELRRGDLDLRTNRVKIRRGVVRVGGAFIVGPPKTDAGIRDVALPPHLVPSSRDTSPTSPAPARAPCSFPRPRTTSSTWRHPRSTKSSTQPASPRAREAAGRKDLRWHDLRHTGAVLAAQTGATLAELMGRLGHTTPGAAMRYQHAAADRERRSRDASQASSRRQTRMAHSRAPRVAQVLPSSI